MPLWLNDNKIVIDSSGYPIDCAHCPCDDIPDVDCSPCTYWETDQYVNTAKESLTLTYSGFGDAGADDPCAPWPETCSVPPHNSCGSSCAAMNSSWTMTNQAWTDHCQWGVSHDLCNISNVPTGASQVYFWNASSLWIDNTGTYGAENEEWDLHLELWSDAGYIHWTKLLSRPNADISLDPGCLGPDFRQNWCDAADGLCSPPYKPDCSQVENCATFTSADIRTFHWYGVSGLGFSHGWHHCDFYGFDCPCDIGWNGGVSYSGGGIPYVETTSIPGSSITATVTGW